MNPWWRLNLALGAFATAMLLVLLWPRWAGSPEATRLGQLATAEIDRIRIERGHRLVLAFERRGDRWHLIHPERRPARNQRVGQLLAIANAPLGRRFSADASLADYGLAPPAAVVQFNQLRIAFGDRAPSQDQRYVQTDDAVGLVDDLYFNLLNMPQTHYLED